MVAQDVYTDKQSLNSVHQNKKISQNMVITQIVARNLTSIFFPISGSPHHNVCNSVSPASAASKWLIVMLSVALSVL